MSGLADRLRKFLGGAPPAVRELARLRVPFTAAEFLERIQQGDYALARTFLDAGISPNATDEEGASALMLAAAAGHSEIVDALLEKGAEVDARSPDGRTALMWCAGSRTSSTAVLQSLLAKGADAGARTEDGSSAFLLAATSGNEESGRMLAGHPKAAKDFGERVKAGQLDAIDRFLDAGIDPNVVVTDKGMRALAYAALLGRMPVVTRLLSAGADVESAGADGVTALMYALIGQGNSVPLVQTLLEHGADVDRNSASGVSAVTVAGVYEGMAVSEEVARLVRERSQVARPQPKGS